MLKKYPHYYGPSPSAVVKHFMGDLLGINFS
jgi:hypothetical protein